MNNLMVFENKKVEVFEWNGKVLFNPKHVAECLDIADVNSSIRNFNEKQVIKLRNSDMHNMHIRKLNNAGENFLTESGVYKLIFKSHKAEAEKFQDWVTDEVLPQIRRTGSYQNQQHLVNEIRGQIATQIKDIFEDKIAEAKKYYKIKSKSKMDISNYIKRRLGILRADDEYGQVKARVSLILGINKWEDLDIDSYRNILPIIDESIRVVKFDRPQQIEFWD